jgi:Condensation domain
LADDPAAGPAGQATPAISAAKTELLARWRAGAVPDNLAETELRAEESTADDPPASLQQARHWFRRDRLTNTTRRNIAFAAVLEARLDYDALVESVDALADRHEVLRTTLYERAGEVRQRVHRRSMVRCDLVDLRSHGTPFEAAVASVRAVLNDGLDLTRGPLALALVYRLADTRHLLAIVCNHVVADGWSLAVALRELDEIYRSRVEGHTAALPPLPIQYRDYARWQREWLSGAEARAHARYWEGILRDRPGKRLPAESAATSADDDPSGHLPIAVDTELTTAVRSFARRSQTTPFVVLLGAYAAALRERIGADDVLVAIAVARRRLPQTHQLIGFFAGAICVRIETGGDPTFAELIRHVHGRCLSGIAHEELDLTGYLRLSEPLRDEDADPIACAGFFLQPPLPAFALAAGALEPIEIRSGHVPTEPQIALFDNGRSIGGGLDYSTRVLSRGNAAMLADDFMRFVRSGIRQPTRTLARLCDGA